jgi:hypothetical protein
MHWFDTAGEGAALIAGTRPGGNSANGNSVMFDAGKILACGGSESFAKPEFPSTTEASLIVIGKPNTQVQVCHSISPAAVPELTATCHRVTLDLVPLAQSCVVESSFQDGRKVLEAPGAECTALASQQYALTQAISIPG